MTRRYFFTSHRITAGARRHNREPCGARTQPTPPTKMGVLERLEEQRRYEIHQKKLRVTRNVVKKQDKGARVMKRFDPDTMATANRQREVRSPAQNHPEDERIGVRTERITKLTESRPDR